MEAYSGIYTTIGIDKRVQNLIKKNAGINLNTVAGATLAVAYQTLIGSYGFSEIQALETIKLAKPAAESVEAALEDVEKLRATPIVISDRKYVSVGHGDVNNIKILDMEIMEEVSFEEYFQNIPAPISSDAIDLSAITMRIVIPHLEALVSESATQPQET